MSHCVHLAEFWLIFRCTGCFLHPMQAGSGIHLDRLSTPDGDQEKRERRYSGWKRAVASSRGWIEH